MVIALSVAVVCVSGSWFTPQGTALEVYPSDSVTEIRMLSQYNPNLAGTPGDTLVLVFQGEEPGGTLFVMGGAHPDEGAGALAAVLIAERARVTRGRMIVIPYANASGFSHTLPQEGYPSSFRISTPSGDRIMPYGSRLTNPVHQWPDPTVYVEPVASQKLAGTESRNLNRAYPGKVDGTLTQRVAYAIMRILVDEHVDVAIDMHESSPEYPVNNAIVAHERAMDIAALASINLADEAVDIGIEPSPPSLRGLSHREWGDHTQVLAFLLESPNPAQGRLRGRTDESLIVSGKDKMYVKAAGQGRLFIPYTRAGVPIDQRVGRHVASVLAITSVFSDLNPDRGIVVEGVPSYQEIISSGVGSFISPSAYGGR
jgi:hypothetical protein